jgi:hypothetical protein
MKINKIFLVSIMILILINVINASDVETITCTKEELLEMCKNFKWIEDIIQQQLENGTINNNQLQIIDILEHANFNLQYSLDTCEKRLLNKNINEYLVYFLVVIVIILGLLRIVDLIKLRKKKK